MWQIWKTLVVYRNDNYFWLRNIWFYFTEKTSADLLDKRFDINLYANYNT